MNIVRHLASLAFLLFAPALSAQDSPAVFSKAGISIKPLDAEIGKAPQIIAMFYLPPTDGFSPNVNVIAIPVANGMAGFIEATKKEFEALNQTFVAQNSPDNKTWVFEAKGAREGKDLHFYARAVLKGSTVYLATGTTLETQWKPSGDQLKASIDSLRLK